MSESIILPDGKHVKLGRIKPKSRPNALRLAAYLSGTVNLPTTLDYSAKAATSIARMYLNDQYGDCVIASIYHSLGIWTGNESGNSVLATDAEIYDSYQGICGRGDNGCDIVAVLNYMKANGIKANGKQYKIDGYVSVDWTNLEEVKTAIYLFGSIKIGVELPNAWAQTSDGGIWDSTNTRIVGGHDICGVGWNEKGILISTWGGLRTITNEAFTSKNWVDEVYTMLSPDWYAQDFVAPSGLDVISLTEDLQKIGGGIDPNPPVPVPIPPKPVSSGLTLDQATKAITDGIENGKPYGFFGVVDKIESAAVAALQAAWPKS